MTADLLDTNLAELGRALDRLPVTGAGAETVEAMLGEAQARLPWPRIQLALLERVALLDTERDRLALVLHATDSDVAGAARGKRDLAAVFEVLVAAADAAALDRFLARVRPILETLPAARGDLPTVERLIEIADQIEGDHEDTADRLVTLAQIVEDLDEAERLAEEAAAAAAAKAAADARG